MSITILPRSDWTRTPDNRHDDLDPSRVVGIAVHYPAVGDKILAKSTKAQVAAWLEGWRKYHVNGHGWRDIGYNYAIDQAGRIWFLTGLDVGAHANAVGNPTRVGVLFVIGDNEEPTPEAIAAFNQFHHWVLQFLPKALKVEGHQEIPGNSTACPGKPLMAAIKDGRLGTKGDTPSPSKPEKNPKPVKYSGESIVDYLNARGQDSSFSARAKLASSHRIPNYTGTAKQNLRLLSILRGGGSSSGGGSASTVSQMATEVIDGKHGNGHAERQRSLGVSEAVYTRVRDEVNRRLLGKGSAPAKKTNSQIVLEVIEGVWGNDPSRSRRLKAAGYNPRTIQDMVNKKVRS